MGMVRWPCIFLPMVTPWRHSTIFWEPLRAQLEKAGVRIINEPYPLEKPDYVVRSSAVQASDSRLLSFETQGIKVWQGGILAHICKSKKVVAVVGSHGKTTTTGMLTWALDQIGFDFLTWLAVDFGMMSCPLVKPRLNPLG